MTTTQQLNAGDAGVQQVADQADPHEISWQDAKELGLDPAPAGLTEDDETQQA